MESMGQRMAGGLLYPLRGGEAITLIVLAIASVFPFISFLATLASTVMMLSVIRRSAEGSTKMPSAIDTGSMDEMTRHYLRVIFVTLVSLSPLIVLGIFFIRWGTRHTNPILLVLAMLVCLAFAILYYPACLATVAVWDSVLDALNPVYVTRVIAHIGADYFIVIGAWFAGIAATTLLKIPALSPVAGIPIVGGIFGSALSLWLLFYSSHLLGYAIFRHSSELGWD
jgi:Na+-transporting methylmalonyl-CoA/oxaloacetate decarboxylase gamma subunit